VLHLHAVASLTHEDLLATRRAFDAAAPGYDEATEDNPVLRAFRDRTLAPILATVPRGASVLDLGCGSGIDAARMAAAGYRVTAIDWSPAMVERTAARARAQGVAHAVDARVLGIHELDRLPAGAFEAAYSDLGPLNCVADLSAAAGLIARAVRPRGLVSASIMGRLVPWEVLRHLMRGDLARARVRFARAAVPVPMGEGTVPTRYYAPTEARRAFERAGFDVLSTRALGAIVPPPWFGFAGRRARVVRALLAIEDRLAAWPPFCHCGDHFLIVARKPAGTPPAAPGFRTT
jgi:SAM-dependent methyltransferase